jgi:hypothetical protein
VRPAIRVARHARAVGGLVGREEQTACAMSSAVPLRPSGICPIALARTDSGAAACLVPQSTQPGHAVFTVMPSGPTCRANPR